jgi:hypothetical protein
MGVASQPAAGREFVHYHSDLTPGSIIVSEHERKLYLIVDQDDAMECTPFDRTSGGAA